MASWAMDRGERERAAGPTSEVRGLGRNVLLLDVCAAECWVLHGLFWKALALTLRGRVREMGAACGFACVQ